VPELASLFGWPLGLVRRVARYQDSDWLLVCSLEKSLPRLAVVLFQPSGQMPSSIHYRWCRQGGEGTVGLRASLAQAHAAPRRSSPAGTPTGDREFMAGNLWSILHPTEVRRKREQGSSWNPSRAWNRMSRSAEHRLAPRSSSRPCHEPLPAFRPLPRPPAQSPLRSV